MTTCDAGPLFALIDPRQVANHGRCKAMLATLSPPLVTTWPCFTEAMYLAHRVGGWPMQRLLWPFIAQRVLIIHESGQAEADRMAKLMERYCDTPMDLADASLVVAAEALGTTRTLPSTTTSGSISGPIPGRSKSSLERSRRARHPRFPIDAALAQESPSG